MYIDDNISITLKYLMNNVVFIFKYDYPCKEHTTFY